MDFDEPIYGLLGEKDAEIHKLQTEVERLRADVDRWVATSQAQALEEHRLRAENTRLRAENTTLRALPTQFIPSPYYSEGCVVACTPLADGVRHHAKCEWVKRVLREAEDAHSTGQPAT